VNLKGAFFSVQQALPLLSRGSAIVLNGSTAGAKAVAGAVAYGASKAGLRSLGRSLASELVSRGVRVNVVSPGPTATPIFHRANGVPSHSVSAFMREEISSVPLMRMGAPEEVAAAVLFLASDEAAFVTGTEFFVDGGVANL
jgi:NAD(P)-dependent dehydrogenase (short-subunit alcohol dehydrogenase family)